MTDRPIIAVTCLSFEARVAAGNGVSVLCGSAQRYMDRIESAVRAGGRGIISIGIAGGLAPGLVPGDWVVARGVVTDDVRIQTDGVWSQRLLGALPRAIYADISGTDSPVVTRSDKKDMHDAHGTVAVDMESHIAARIAARHGVPFAACRVIIDPAERTLPPAALVGMRDDGRPDVRAVVRSLFQQPSQALSLMRVISDARAARSALFRGRRRLGENLSFPGEMMPRAREPELSESEPALAFQTT